MRCRIIALAFVLFFMAVFSSSQTGTKVKVGNSFPQLIKNFTDITIAKDRNATNYLDLDDYFIDLNGDPITYTHSLVTNVQIIIDGENRVSFIPDAGYVGNQSMFFYASDGYGNTSSNEFQLIVSPDTQAPRWLNPSKNRETIYQNSHVNFSATWTDDYQLSYFIFSINEGSAWKNLSLVNFSGTLNTSIQEYQISAPGGRVVYWRFYASDESSNINATDILNFTVSEVVSSSGKGAAAATGKGSAKAAGPTPTSQASKAKFSATPATIKVSLRQGDVLTRLVRIKNPTSETITVTALIEGVESLTKLSKKTFQINPGETFDLLVDFMIPRDTKPDQYFGKLILQSIDKIVIPLVIDVKKFDSAIELTVNISKKFKFVLPGSPVKAKISIRRLKDLRREKASLFYSIKDFQGNVLDSNDEEIDLYESYVEEKTLQFPENGLEGEYIFYARVITKEDIGLDSDTFFVGAKFQLLYWAKLLFYPLVILFLLSIIFFLILLHEKNRKKRRALELYLLLNELKKLLKEKKLNEALEVYKKIKLAYGEHIDKEHLSIEDLKKELSKFSQMLSENADSLKIKEEGQESKEKTKIENPEENANKEKQKASEDAKDSNTGPPAGEENKNFKKDNLNEEPKKEDG